MPDRRLRLVRRGTDGSVGDEEILAALDDTTIEVRVGGSNPRWGTQLLAEALVDLLGRLFPRILVTCAPDARSEARLPPGSSLLRDRLEQARRHGHPPQQADVPTVTVHVGSGAGPADLYADGSGWQAYLGTVPSRLPDRDAAAAAAAAGPLTAACRAAAHAFGLAMGNLLPATPPPDSIYWSALDYAHGPDPLGVASPAWEPELAAVLAGAGSIGGAAVYAFARTPGLRGAIDIVDPEALVDTNPDRALLATAQASEAGEDKADVAIAALAHLDGLSATPHVTDLAGFVASRPRENTLPLTLCAVDTMKARRAIQDCLPLELLNAACDPVNSVVSAHRTGNGPCVMCLFMKRLMDREQALYRLIARATALNERMVAFMMATRVPLADQHLRGIEDHRGLPRGAYADYHDRTLRELWHAELEYGGIRVQTKTGAVVAVAAPWVTALSGFLLASETLKAGAAGLHPYRLGRARSDGALRYAESAYASPSFAQLTRPERWPHEQCLCNSPRRRRLILERYELAADDYPI